MSWVIILLLHVTDGFTQEDLMLMLAKTDFMARLRPHINIVKFIGAVENTNMEGIGFGNITGMNCMIWKMNTLDTISVSSPQAIWITIIQI